MNTCCSWLVQLRCGGSVGGKGKLLEKYGGDGASIGVIEGGRNSRNMAIKKRRWWYLRWQWRVTKKVQVHDCGVSGHVVDECKRNVTMTCSVP